MGSYVVHFIVYTLAMSGLICFALFVYKKFMHGGFAAKGAKTLSIEETMNINPRKSLMIVKAGEERFLIASDVDKTSLIAKLDSDVTVRQTVQPKLTVQNQDQEMDRFKDIIRIAKQENIKSIDISDFVASKSTNTNVTDIKKAKKNKVEVSGKNPIHLEVITDMNPNVQDWGNRKTKYTSKNHGKKVNINVGEVKNHGFSTMKEMAAKVYEL